MTSLKHLDKEFQAAEPKEAKLR